MHHRLVYIILFLIVWISGCIEEFTPKIDNYDELLVVDGVLSNAPGPQTVTLTRSSDVNKHEPVWETGALVSIIDSTGEVEYLGEIEPGKYETRDDYSGIAGHYYKVRIALKTGNTYESDYQLLREAPPIDSVYGEVEKNNTSQFNHIREGMQFYVDTKNEIQSSEYLLWRMIETYLFHSDFILDYVFAGTLEKSHDPYKFYWCYRIEKIKETQVFSTTDRTSNMVKRLPLTFVDTETKRLSVRYSLFVNQYAVSEKAYQYWDDILKQNDEQGSFYTRQPFQVRGNIKNMANPAEPVLGFFIVGGVNSKRIFVNRPKELYFNYGTCFLNLDLSKLALKPPSEYPIYLSLNEKNELGYAARSCFDCRLVWGQLERPDYWE